MGFSPKDSHLSYLPLAHVFERGVQVCQFNNLDFVSMAVPFSSQRIAVLLLLVWSFLPKDQFFQLYFTLLQPVLCGGSKIFYVDVTYN